jgi:hypothetical protein
VKGRFSCPIFWALVAVFIFLVCFFFIPALMELLAGSELFLTPLAVFFLLGVALVVFTLREKVGGTLKKFFLLSGASSAGFFLFVLLHNAFYALAVVSSNIPVLGSIMEFLHAAFFFMAVPICPLAFLVGAIGTIVLKFRNSGAERKPASSSR